MNDSLFSSETGHWIYSQSLHFNTTVFNLELMHTIIY